MKLLRILIVFLVFMMMWNKTSNQEINLNKTLDERMKRNDESDLIRHKLRIEEVKSERKGKNILTNSIIPQIGLNSRPPFSNLGTSNIVVTPQLMKINQAQNKNGVNNRKPFVLYTPNYNFGTKRTDYGNSEKTVPKTVNLEEKYKGNVEETQEVKEGEKIDAVVIEKANEIADKDLTFREKTNFELQKPEVVKKKSKKAHRHLHPHINKKSHGKNDGSKTENSYQPLLDDKLDNKLTEPTINLGKIKCEGEKTSKESVHTETDLDKVININKEHRKEDKTVLQPKRHPFLDAIQNDRYITSSKDITSKLKEEDKVTVTDFDETEIKIEKDLEILERSSSVSNLPNEVDLSQDESEEIIIKNENIEEVIEVPKPINPIYQGNAQNNAPAFYENYQASNNNQVPRTSNGDNIYKQTYNHNVPDDQQTFQDKDGNTVTYHNYFKLPTGSVNSNNNIYPYNNNRHYEYPASQYQGDLGYNNNNQYYAYNPSQNKNGYWSNGYYQSNSNDKDRIWRSWNNTEYYLKSKSKENL